MSYKDLGPCVRGAGVETPKMFSSQELEINVWPRGQAIGQGLSSCQRVNTIAAIPTFGVQVPKHRVWRVSMLGIVAMVLGTYLLFRYLGP